MMLSSMKSLVAICSFSTKQQSALPSIIGAANEFAFTGLLASPSTIQCSAKRPYTYHRISRNIEFYSADDNVTLKRSPDTLCLTSSVPPPNGRPITILMSWLMSREKHVKKFAKMYTDLGMDVLKIRVSPFDLLRPTKGSQVVAGQMLEFLHQNSVQSPILVHGFSVGAYVFCEGLIKAEKNIDKHQPVLERFVGQIWDSPVDIQGIPKGVSEAISDNRIIRASIRKYIEWHMRMKYETATVHYENSSRMMHRGFLKSPSLFLVSEKDVIAPPDMVASVYNKWDKKGQTVFVKRFEKSIHVSHYRMYKKEYIEEIMAFLQKVGLADANKAEAAA